MDKLLEALAEKGIRVQGVSDKEVLKIAKNVGLDPKKYLPRGEVEIVSHTNKRNETNKFVKTPFYTLGEDEHGKVQQVRGLFVRADIVDQIIEDLLTAKGLLQDEE